MMQAVADWLERRSAATLCWSLGLVTWLVCLIRLDRPAKPMFDEVHYLPAARAVIDLIGPINEEHPLLAKQLIALSITLFGDDPGGWRLLSTVAGAASVMLVFAIAMSLYRSTRTAATAALLMLFGQLVYIQARLAMLDVYMGAFLLGALALALHVPNARRPRAVMVCTGLCLGAAVACKWAAVPLAALIGLGLMIRGFRRGGLEHIAPNPEPHSAHPEEPLSEVEAASRRTHRAGPSRRAFDFAQSLLRMSGSWRASTALARALGVGVLVGGSAALLYLASFWPLLFYAGSPFAIADLIPYQLRMFELQTQPLSPHRYESPAWSWPLMIRPIWYLYERVGDATEGVLLIGNPVVMWGGLVAVVAGLIAGLRDRAWAVALPALLWIATMAQWLIIPKKISFFYYYYLPALFLPLALAAVFHHYRGRKAPALFLMLATLTFVYFFPIISATPLSDPLAFRRWMWLPSWP